MAPRDSAHVHSCILDSSEMFMQSILRVTKVPKFGDRQEWLREQIWRIQDAVDVRTLLTAIIRCNVGHMVSVHMKYMASLLCSSQPTLFCYRTEHCV